MTDFHDWAPNGAVPPEMRSAYSGGEFDRCSDCGAVFAETGAPHLVEKVIRDGETIFEYAVCTGCAFVLWTEYSEESKRNLEAYFAERLDADAAPDSCRRCGASAASIAEEHTIACVALGGTLLGEVIRICGACADGAEKVLSKKTKEAFDRFVRRVCPTLPADIDLPTSVLPVG